MNFLCLVYTYFLPVFIELKESERGSVMVEISRPFESMHPGLRLDGLYPIHPINLILATTLGVNRTVVTGQFAFYLNLDT